MRKKKRCLANSYVFNCNLERWERYNFLCHIMLHLKRVKRVKSPFKLLNMQLQEEILRMKQWKERKPTLHVCRALIKRKNDISIPPRHWGITERLEPSQLIPAAVLLFHLGGEICSNMFASSIQSELLMIPVRLKEQGSKGWLQLDIFNK